MNPVLPHFALREPPTLSAYLEPPSLEQRCAVLALLVLGSCFLASQGVVWTLAVVGISLFVGYGIQNNAEDYFFSFSDDILTIGKTQRYVQRLFASSLTLGGATVPASGALALYGAGMLAGGSAILGAGAVLTAGLVLSKTIPEFQKAYTLTTRKSQFLQIFEALRQKQLFLNNNIYQHLCKVYTALGFEETSEQMLRHIEKARQELGDSLFEMYVVGLLPILNEETLLQLINLYPEQLATYSLLDACPDESFPACKKVKDRLLLIEMGDSLDPVLVIPLLMKELGKDLTVKVMKPFVTKAIKTGNFVKDEFWKQIKPLLSAAVKTQLLADYPSLEDKPSEPAAGGLTSEEPALDEPPFYGSLLDSMD